MGQLADVEAEAARFEAEIAEVCGVINAATGRLVQLIRLVAETGSWEGVGIRSLEQWVAWKCGVGPARARSLVAMARRLAELPETRAAFEAGELAEDQVAVVVRHAPTSTDAEVADLARYTTVSQLKRTLSSYRFAEPSQPTDQPAAEPPVEERRVSFGYDDDGLWRLAAVLPADEGALWERALAEARDSLFRAQRSDATKVSWVDALVAVADRSLGAGAADRPHRDRHLVMVHVGATPGGGVGGHVHLGPELPAGLRQYLGCDARVRAVFESGGTPVSVGRSYRTVPDRTRTVIEERDGGCRVPGCDRTRWLHVHHIRHWEDGGPSDTPNLLALCSVHHRLLHRGGLRITGNADDPTAWCSPITVAGASAPAVGRNRPTARSPTPPGPSASPSRAGSIRRESGSTPGRSSSASQPERGTTEHRLRKSRRGPSSISIPSSPSTARYPMIGWAVAKEGRRSAAPSVKPGDKGRQRRASIMSSDPPIANPQCEEPSNQEVSGSTNQGWRCPQP